MRRTHLRWLTFVLLWTLVLPTRGFASDDADGPNDCSRTPTDFGDAPEGTPAYPGVIGHFPTCTAPTAPGTQELAPGCPSPIPPPGQTGYVEHIHPAGEANYWLGCGSPAVGPSGIDGEPDAKVNSSGAGFSSCDPTLMVDCVESAFGMSFGQDECYGGEDAGLATPLVFTPCQQASFSFQTYNCGPTRQAFLNVLIDMNKDGDWNDSFQCPTGGCAFEWAVQNVPFDVQQGCAAVLAPGFMIGPNAGPSWLRITISDEPVPPDFAWNGSGSLPGGVLHNGETEDYPVVIRGPQPPCPSYEDWGDAPEGVQAYPGIQGHFPTCSAAAATAGSAEVASGCTPRSIAPSAADMAGYVRHLSSPSDNAQFWLGCPNTLQNTLGVDSETDGKTNDNGSPFSSCNNTIAVDGWEGYGLTYGQDESYGDGVDAGLDGPMLQFKTCTQASVTFKTYNCRSSAAEGYLNILVDMNQDGDWNDNFLCPGAAPICAYEWAVKNQVVSMLPGCQTHTSNPFMVGPNAGQSWMRITLTTTPITDDAFPWKGSAGPVGAPDYFVGGETEDYPVAIKPDFVGVSDRQPQVGSLSMAPLAPNPAGNQVMVRFTLPHSADVSLAAYDVAGRKLAEIASGRLEAGEHRVSWNFTDARGRAVPAGYYIVKLHVGDLVTTQRGIRVR